MRSKIVNLFVFVLMVQPSGCKHLPESQLNETQPSSEGTNREVINKINNFEYRPLDHSGKYMVDMRFLKDGSILQSDQDIADAFIEMKLRIHGKETYNSTVVTAQFTQDFSQIDKEVELIALATPHYPYSRENDEDGFPQFVTHDKEIEFLEAQIQKIEDPSIATLFVEQSLPQAAKIESLEIYLVNAGEKLKAYTDEIRREKVGIYSENWEEDKTFNEAASYWNEAGGKVVNFDLNANFNRGALEFLFRQASPQDAAAFLFNSAQLATGDYKFGRNQELVLALIGHIVEFEKPDMSPSYRSEFFSALKGTISDLSNYHKDLLRERYMRFVLANVAKDGDVVLAHNRHIQALFEPEMRAFASR